MFNRLNYEDQQGRKRLEQIINHLYLTDIHRILYLMVTKEFFLKCTWNSIKYKTKNFNKFKIVEIASSTTMEQNYKQDNLEIHKYVKIKILWNNQ